VRRAAPLAVWLAAATWTLLAPPAWAGPARYATTPMLEPDRCATAWVIRRYLDPEARIEFHPRDAMPEDVILFDLPEAELKRDARRATLEALIEQRGLTDPYVLTLARLIHDIEINAWARRDVPDSPLFERLLMDELRDTGDLLAALARCLTLLDRLRQHDGNIAAWASELVGAKSPDPQPGASSP
jgi:hypothetical protein